MTDQEKQAIKDAYQQGLVSLIGVLASELDDPQDPDHKEHFIAGVSLLRQAAKIAIEVLG